MKNRNVFNREVGIKDIEPWVYYEEEDEEIGLFKCIKDTEPWFIPCSSKTGLIKCIIKI